MVKLIPENYKIQILPAFFNYTDPERLRTVVADQAFEFIVVSLNIKLADVPLENSQEGDVLCCGEGLLFS